MRLLVTLIISLLSGNLAYADDDRLLPQESEYLKSVGGGYLYSGEGGQVFIYLTLEMSEELPDEIIFSAIFDNPADTDRPFLNPSKIDFDGNRLLLQSPLLSCIDNGGIYRTETRIMDGKQNLLGVHVQWLRFSMPDQEFRQLGLRSCETNET